MSAVLDGLKSYEQQKAQRGTEVLQNLSTRLGSSFEAFRAGFSQFKEAIRSGAGELFKVAIGVVVDAPKDTREGVERIKETTRTAYATARGAAQDLARDQRQKQLDKLCLESSKVICSKIEKANLPKDIENKILKFYATSLRSEMESLAQSPDSLTSALKGLVVKPKLKALEKEMLKVIDSGVQVKHAREAERAAIKARREAARKFDDVFAKGRV